MTAIDYILDGLEAELELERELGVRVVEIDRALLAPATTPKPAARRDEGIAPYQRLAAPASAPKPAAPIETSKTQNQPPNDLTAPKPKHPKTQTTQTPQSPNTPQPLSFVFLHDRALSAGGVEMMAKIVTAMKQTPETAPIVFMGERPAAKLYVVLGGLALRKWYPTLRGAPGQWLRGPGGEDVLVTYSPEYILRFGTVTPAVKKIKVEMWTSLKGVMQRVNGRIIE